MLYAGSSLDKARQLFAEAVKHRPRIRLTIRQARATYTARSRVHPIPDGPTTSATRVLWIAVLRRRNRQIMGPNRHLA
jgi:hypothetical protein